MTERTARAGLGVDVRLAAFIEGAALPGSGVDPARFWQGLAELVRDFGPAVRAALDRRAQLQAQIDDWHIAQRGAPHDGADDEAFLRDIGYLVAEGGPFAIATAGCDPEVAMLAGPQLVVPATNARFVLNAVNARWGSLYDALYGTDAPGDPPPPGPFEPARGARVVAWAKAHLDRVVPLAAGSWARVTALAVRGGALVATVDGAATGLADPAQFVGWAEGDLCPLQVVLRVHGLHIEILVDPATPVGATDPAGISDIWVEAAPTAIVDLEDSVACVDGADKVAAYANWLGLMQGTLAADVVKGGKAVTRRMNPTHVDYRAPGGGTVRLRTRSLLWVRNVGHLMTTPAVLDPEGAEVGEGLLDAMVTVLCACHDLRGPRANSPAGSVYLVKPKLHGPEEVALTVTILDRVEDALDLPRNTVKLGLMDEERRTSANLRECIRAARERIAFVNTGFLDRTGDEIHTAMEAGPMVPKAAMRHQRWIAAYEARNVAIALDCGFAGRAQIGKGMWAMPDRMADMLAQKGAHPAAGASCAWVPSPTAAVLHALHYHLTDVAAVQAMLARSGAAATLGDLLTLPRLPGGQVDPATVAREVDNNVQGILGYVVRWVDQGIGCSKVPDIDDVALMEDRATCRISAQALANWLHHGIVTEAQVMDALRRMAAVVDRQNAGDPAYRPMAPACDGPAFAAAAELILRGRLQPSGYTEPVLHRRRLQVKAGG